MHVSSRLASASLALYSSRCQLSAKSIEAQLSPLAAAAVLLAAAGELSAD